MSLKTGTCAAYPKEVADQKNRQHLDIIKNVEMWKCGNMEMGKYEIADFEMEGLEDFHLIQHANNQKNLKKCENMKK